MKTSVKRRAKNCIRGTVLLACFIAVWYVASCFTQPLFIPAPATVWEAIVGLAETGQLQKGLAYSFLRITGASALSMLVAIPLSLLIYGVKPTVGNGNTKMVADPGSADAYLNRRTDVFFKIIEE